MKLLATACVLLSISALLPSAWASQRPREFPKTLSEYLPEWEKARAIVPYDASSLVRTLNRNSACAEAGLNSLVFKNVDAVPEPLDFCQIPEASIPRPAAVFLANVKGVTTRLSAVLGVPFASLFGQGLELRVKGGFLGATDSYAVKEGIELAVFQDWKESEFSAAILAHELTHYLSYNRNPVGSAFFLSYDHPMLAEAFPDVIASQALGTSSIGPGDTDSPACVGARDGTPTQALTAPLQNFFVGASYNARVRCCSQYRAGARTRRGDALCGAEEREQTFEAVLTALKRQGNAPVSMIRADLPKPYAPDLCLASNGRFDSLALCEVHAYGPYLMSFFETLRARTGRNLVPEFLKALLATQLQVPTYVCSLPQAKKAPLLKTVRMRVQGVMPAFKALRSGLSATERLDFDRTWGEHAFDRISRMDELYVSSTLKTAGLRMLSAQNLPHDIQYGCSDLAAKVDPAHCAVTCKAEKQPAGKTGASTR